MVDFAFLLKTYRADLGYSIRMIESYQKFNSDNILMYVVVPKKDLDIFNQFSDKTIFVFAEEDLFSDLCKESFNGFSAGYINQSIIKLSFWKTKLCENYMCLDDDGYFIRNFYISDFMYNSEIPYTILEEDNELKVDSFYYSHFWIGREKGLKLIQKELDYEDKRMLTNHAFPILSSKVLKDFDDRYLIINGLTYEDIIKKSPYDFTWYNFWLQKTECMPLKSREPLFKFFHTQNEHINYYAKGNTLEDIKRGYLGVVVNSNYSRKYGVLNYEDVVKYDEYGLGIKEIMEMQKKVFSSLILKVKLKLNKRKSM